MIRLFTGIDLPTSAKQVLLTTMSGLPHIRWQTQEQLHLTLRFIGAVDSSLAIEIRHQLTTVRFTPFALRIGGLGIFGNENKPRLLWAGIERNAAIHELYQRISTSLEGLGIEPEKRRYTPHVTLGHFQNSRGERVSSYLQHMGGLAVPSVAVTEFALFESRPGSSGSHYQVVESYA